MSSWPRSSDNSPKGIRMHLRRQGWTGPVAGAVALVLGVSALATTAAAAPQEQPPGDVAQLEPGRYIVQLAEPAVATYDGGRPGLAGTRVAEGDQLDARDSDVREYSRHLEERQERVAEAVDVEIDASYTLTLNGFAAELTADQAAQLTKHPQVTGLAPDELHKPAEAEPSTDFLGLSGRRGVWAAVGGAERAGRGVVVGVIDTGISPENPSFAGDELRPRDHTAGKSRHHGGGDRSPAVPYLDDGTIVFDKSDGGTFTGACVEGDGFEADDCTTKLITARYFVDGFGARFIGGHDVGEYLSPRGTAHGSHTASTAAGEHAVPVTLGGHDYPEFSGVAPGAKIAAYKACWDGPNPAIDTDDGCSTVDLLAAVEAAVTDGVDVINFSIGGGAAQGTFEPTDVAFLNAAAAGVFVAASAGNSGPEASTFDNAAPWITTVAASTVPTYEATATLGDGTQALGASTTVWAQLSADLVRGDQVMAADYQGDPVNDLGPAEAALLCAPGSLDPDRVAGKIVLCERGVHARVDKSAETARAGAVGTLLVNRGDDGLSGDLHANPTVHAPHTRWDELYRYAGTSGATVTFTPDNVTGTATPTPQIAGFSSRGPLAVEGSDILKPDIAAPGVDILAAYNNAPGAAGEYGFMSGTSMAAPHIAGLAALYLGERPRATPAEIKSAMMTTAYDTVDETGATAADPMAQGAGHADPTKFFEPGLLYLNDADDWAAYAQGLGAGDFGVEPITPSNLNLPSIAVGDLTGPETVTRTVTSTGRGTFRAEVEGLDGIDVTVSPSRLSFSRPGQTRTFTVRFDRTDAAPEAWADGFLTWTSTERHHRTEARSPIAVLPALVTPPSEATGTGTDGSVSFDVSSSADTEVPVTVLGLESGELRADPYGDTTEHSGIGTNDGTGTPEYQWIAEVGDGTEFARFDVDSLVDEPDADLDLFVYKLDDAAYQDGELVATDRWVSGTEAADERVDLTGPEPGAYVVQVDVYAGSDVPFDYTETFLEPGGAGLGDLTVAPDPVPVSEGGTSTVTVSWSGLPPGDDYVGALLYQGTERLTLVKVTARD